jgi:hypothetical protein
LYDQTPIVSVRTCMLKYNGNFFAFSFLQHLDFYITKLYEHLVTISFKLKPIFVRLSLLVYFFNTLAFTLRINMHILLPQSFN